MAEARAKEIEANANRYMLPRDFHEVTLPDPVTEQWLDSPRKSRKVSLRQDWRKGAGRPSGQGHASGFRR